VSESTKSPFSIRIATRVVIGVEAGIFPASGDSRPLPSYQHSVRGLACDSGKLKSDGLLSGAIQNSHRIELSISQEHCCTTSSVRSAWKNHIVETRR
jgi:hypothetical protein